MYTSLTLSSQEERGLVLFHGDSCELISISSQDYDIYFNSVQTNKQKKNLECWRDLLIYRNRVWTVVGNRQ